MNRLIKAWTQRKSWSPLAFSGALWIFFGSLVAHAEAPKTPFPETMLDHRTSNDEVQLAIPNPAALTLFQGASTDWAALIDATWGPAPWPIADQLTWFDAVRDTLDRNFACFDGIVDNFDSLATAYRSEIVAGVSKGRYAAILNHLNLSLQESHTMAYISQVNSTALAPGIPLMAIGAWGEVGHFGAGLTPRPDKSLLVYETVPDHPLGLVPGDIVLGYEGIPWEQLYQELLTAELPLRYMSADGGSPSSFEHSLLMAAGLNWHLFETIDIVKHDTGDTLNLSTAPLDGASMSLFCREQLPVSGVDFPDPSGGEFVTYGRLTDTNIGYIYVRAWSGNADLYFHAAALNLRDTDGLIIDFRLNWGGLVHYSNGGLSVLFDHVVPTINFDKRCPGGDHLDMCSAGFDSTDFDIPGHPATSYGNPIAVLVGPGAVSAGDFVAYRMTFHPHARIFGKPTASAFNSPIFYNPGGSPISAGYARYSAYPLSDPSNYLTHDEFPVDVPVWLTQSDVAQGVDTVVGAALAWIQDPMTEAPELAESGSDRPLSSFPNPFADYTTIRHSVPGTRRVSLSIYDVTGRLVRTLENDAPSQEGEATIWDGRDGHGMRVVDGTYFVKIRAGDVIQTGKVVHLGGK